MNGTPLLMNHGAPLRLRVETKLGFKMIKWLKSADMLIPLTPVNSEFQRDRSNAARADRRERDKHIRRIG
jgi:DMSO/TMAO reductase YedYZ molybdopterin-dependent catalytic subunit